MATDIKEIASINFGIYSQEEILNMSVCKIDNPKKTGYGSVYDPRMGNTDSNQNCETCGENALVCTGHFGYVELAEPIIHPLYYKRVISLLNCFCFKCYRLILTKDQIYLLKLNRAKGENRFLKIQEKITKVDICCHDDCKSYQPKFKMSVAENTIYMTYNYKNKNKTSVVVSTEEIKRVFDNISNEDVKLLGFDPKLTHPKNFIITYLPIIPPCDRPFVKADGNTCDDDITIQYIEIIKANNYLLELIEESKEGQKEILETKKQKLISTIRFRILTTFNNSAGKAKHTTNGRPIKGIKERLTGKDGQLRNNLLGKRCLAENTDVLSWSGNTKKAREIQIGDVIVGDDGFSRVVINTCVGESIMYRIEQENGDMYEVNDNHIITVFSKGEVYWKKDKWILEWIDYSLNKISKSFSPAKYKSKINAYNRAQLYRKTFTDKYIDIPIETYIDLDDSIKRLLYGVKLNTYIRWNKKEVSIEPYLFGTLINEQKIERIPEEYIINDKETRLKVLAGIIDTSEGIDCDGKSIVISNNFYSIIQDIKQICQTIGIALKTNDKQIKLYGKGIEEIPTLIKSMISPSLDNFSIHNIKVSKIGIGRYCGFEVDQNNRFLLGDYTITHNCNQTGRTVIGPDPTLKMGQLAVPELMANILTVPERVTAFNKDKLQKLVNSGDVNSLIKPDGKTCINLKRFRKGTRLTPNDIIVRGDKRIVVVSGKEQILPGDQLIRNGESLENIIYSNREYPIDIGWIVERKLSDGDIVLLNRQPTLHRASMLAMEVIVKPHKTLRFNLAINKPFNADFDGDRLFILSSTGGVKSMLPPSQFLF